MEKKPDFKAMSTKTKVGYIWDYYRWPILLTIIGVGVLISIIYNRITYREPVLNVLMINCNNLFSNDDSGFHEFLTGYGYDPEESPVSLNASMYFPEDDYSQSVNELQVLSTLIAAGGQDIFFGRGAIFLNYAEQGAFQDLSTLIPADLLARYEDGLLYAVDEDGTSYPCAVTITDNEWLTKNNYYDSCYFGILYRGSNPETAVQFAEFLLYY